jgi:hypothetical protein
MALGKKNPPPPEVAEQFIAAEKSHFGVIILHTRVKLWIVFYTVPSCTMCLQKKDMT